MSPLPLLWRLTRDAIRRDLLPDEVDVGDDVRERVVDLVRDTGRQRAHRRHAAREDQLVLHPPPIGQVADEEVVALRPGTAALQIDDRHDGQLHVERRAVLARPVNVALDLLLRVLQIGAHQRPVSRRYGRLPAAPDDLRRLVAGQAGEGAVHGHDAPVGVDAADPLGGVFEGGSQLAHLFFQARDQQIRSPHRRHQDLRGRGS